MPRPATGSIVEPKGDRRSWAVRLTVDGRRRIVTLGTPDEGWNLRKAEVERDNLIADVRRGIWKPTEPAPANVAPSTEGETFHQFAEVWFSHRLPEWKPRTVEYYRSALEINLLPTFKDLRLDEISVEVVDRYSRAKQAEGKLSNNSINATLICLSMILELAVEWGRIGSNPAKGRKRKLKTEPRKRLHVEPEQLPSLLESAKLEFRPLVATLALGGLRIGEAIALTWDDVSIATGTIRVRDSKTAAGVREVDMPRGLVDELGELKARTHIPLPGNRIFRTVGGRRPMTQRNAQDRLKWTIRKANEKLLELGIEPIDPGVSPHSLRRLYASLRFGAGDDIVYVSEQIGHTDPSFSMRVYAKAIRRRDKLSGNHLEHFDRAVDLARIGTEGQPRVSGGEPDHIPERS